MKTSNKLILGLAFLGLSGLVAFNAALKADLTRINPKDPLSMLETRPLKPFRVVRIEGRNDLLVGLASGPDFAFRSQRNASEEVSYRMQGDTLVVHLSQNNGYRADAGSYFSSSPHILIQAPRLTAVDVNGATVKLMNWQLDSLTAVVRDSAGGLALAESRIGRLNATVRTTALLQTGHSVRLGDTRIQVRDRARFAAEADRFDKLTLTVDSTAHVDLPGALLSKL